MRLAMALLRRISVLLWLFLPYVSNIVKKLALFRRHEGEGGGGGYFFSVMIMRAGVEGGRGWGAFISLLL